MAKRTRKSAVVRTGYERDTDERVIARAYADGHNPKEILCILNDWRVGNGKEKVSESVVTKTITDLRTMWRRENMEDIGAFIEREDMRLAKMLDKVDHEYEMSKNIRPKEYAPLLKLGYTVKEIDEMFKGKEFSGDSSLLNVKLSITEQRMKLRGADKVDVNQTNVVNYNLDGVNLDELARIADGLQDKKAKEIIASKTIDEQ